MLSMLLGTLPWPAVMAFGVATAGAVVAWLLLALRTAHRRLHEVQEAFHTLTSNVPIGIVQTDANGICTHANETWCDLTGLTLVEMAGHRWSRAVHPDDVADVMRKWEAAVGHGRPYVDRVRLMRPDGTIRSVLATAQPVHDSRGAVTGFLGTVMDITDSMEAEKKLRDQESLLRSLVDHCSAAIYLKDLKSRYLLINRRHFDLWPAMKPFRPGTTPYDWFPEETARSFVESDAQVIRSGREHTFTETIDHEDGPHTYVSVKFPVTDEHGTVIAVGGVSTDVTELEQARHTLAQKEQVLRRLIDVQENEKQQLCHEFHDGLIQYAIGSIMLLDSLMAEAGALAGAARDTVSSAVACLRRGVEDGRRTIRGIRPAALDDLGLASAIEELVDQMREADVPVTATIDPDVDTISAELQTTAYRVVQEALSNVRKHAGSTSAEVSLRRSADGLDLTVVDHGCGFDVQAVGRKGFGLLGMAERVRLVGGDFRIESTPGSGTRITARLPLARTE